MNDIEKFRADIRRVIKYDRADNNGSYDGIRAAKKITDLFCRYNNSLGDLPKSIADYWLETYIEKSPEVENEPTDKNIDWLSTVLEFFDGDSTNSNIISKEDWKVIKDFVNCEAEELPLDVLSSMMGFFVERHIL
ncbi:MAG: hypothetical protein E7062_05970 [Spirochaetaceae bacterium]|nr:hypothetical protein [Spirochaetaceae bacterium]